MKNLKIDTIDDGHLTPVIDFNAETGICEISGESYSEDSYDFYSPVIKWLEEYVTSEKRDLTINMKLSYYDTKSSKSYFKIFRILKSYASKGGEVTINWYYKTNDTDTIEDVEDFMIITGMQINLVKY